MRNTVLLVVVLLLLPSCASQPRQSLLKPIQPPSAVTKPPSASMEGSSLKGLQDSFNAMQQDLTQSLQALHNATQTDLLETLERARKLPARTAPVQHSF